MIAQKSKLRLTPEVLATFAFHGQDHRLIASYELTCYRAPELQLHPRTGNITGPEGAGDAVEDFSLEEERDTTDAETDAEAETEESWCPPNPDAPDDSTESEIAGAADKLEIHDAWVSTSDEYFLPAGQLWRPAIIVAPGEIDHIVNFYSR